MTKIAEFDHTKTVTKTYEESIGKICTVSKDEDGYYIGINDKHEQMWQTFILPKEFAYSIAKAIVLDYLKSGREEVIP